MAEVSEIEAGGEVRKIKDTTARSGVAENAAAIETINARLNSTTRVARMLQNKLAVLNKNKTYAFSLIRGAVTGEFRPFSFVFWGGYLTVNDTVSYYVEGGQIAVFKAIARDGDNFTIQNVSDNVIDIIQLNP